LFEHKRDVYSQTGEDGIIEKILETLPENDEWCVEFGAWDGQYLTNTRYLIEEKEYSAILIEADKKKFLDLQKNYSNSSCVTTINQFVGFTKEDNLDRILEGTEIPLGFDLLSIDIDGNDFHVWKATARYKPKVVVIEFNPTIPTPISFVQPADSSINHGASLLSLVELGKEIGYELVSVLPFNAFFVRKEFFERFQVEDNSPEELRLDSKAVTYFFSGYDGTIFLKGNCKLPWHNIEFDKSKIQQLPSYLRAYPGNYSRLQKLTLKIYKKVILKVSMLFSQIFRFDRCHR